MCGIVGVADFAGRPVSRTLLEQSATLVQHRGPDGQGVWEEHQGDTHVGFGHQRLAVLDLRSCASQPMHNSGCVSQGTASPLALVFNGEIYNFQELRRDLLARGHRFISDTDSEVLLHLYEESGPDMLEQLRGMFAFAIWDARSRQLFCARDRVGKKPFYFNYSAGRFCFASEPRALFVDPTVQIDVDAEAVRAYLALGYVPSGKSAFSGLQRLLPGHSLVVNKLGVKQQRYWCLKYEPKRELSKLDALEELRERLEECVRLRLESDVPLGAFLSGGMDSSVIVALLTKFGAKTKTFSIGFEDTSYNELPYARLVADRCGTDHHEFMVRPELLGIAPKLAWHYGEPYADSSAIPTYELARLASDHITVALNGDGGDETFAGYRRYRAHWAKDSYDQLPQGLREALRDGLQRFPAATRSRGLLYDLQRFFGASDGSRQTQYVSWFGFFGGRRADLNSAFAEATDREALTELEDAFVSTDSLHPVDAAMRADVSLYLPDDLLVKVDIATMAHGLEARSPLLDHTLMEFVARLPVEFKLNFFQGKTLLRRVAKGLIPDDILRRKKAGFGVPLDQWFRGEFGNSAREILLASNAHVQEYVDAVTIRRLFDEHCELRAAHGHRLWALYMLEQWKTVCSVRPTVTNSNQVAVSRVLDRRGL